ncbi:MAG: hypothetical protein AAGG44_18460, partial [Planctomycetota bacterium]
GIEIRSVLTGKKLLDFPVATEYYTQLSFTSDKKSLLLGGGDSLIRFPLSSLTPKVVLKHDYKVPAVATTNDAAEATDTPIPLPPAPWETKPFNSIACSATGWIATGNDKGYISIWSMEDGLRYAALRVGIDRIRVAISKDGRFVAFARNENEVSILDLRSLLPETPTASKHAESLVSTLSF